MDEKKENTILEYWTRRVMLDPVGAAREAATMEIAQKEAQEIRMARAKTETELLESLQKKMDAMHKSFEFNIDKTLERLGLDKLE